MKKLLFILFLIPYAAFSQSSLGIKGGITFSNIYNSDTDFLRGPVIGFIYSKTFNDKTQITIEPSFNFKGFTYKNVGYNFQETDKEEYTYAEVPITFGIVPLNQKFILGINLGLNPEFLIQASYSYKGTDYIINDGTKFNVDFLAGAKAGIRISDKSFIALNFRFGSAIKPLIKYDTTKSYYFTPFLEIGWMLK